MNLRSSKIVLWAWAIALSPIVALLGVAVGGSDGEVPKFVFIFCIVPAALTITLGRLLGLDARSFVPAGIVSAVMGLLVWGVLILALLNAGLN